MEVRLRFKTKSIKALGMLDEDTHEFTKPIKLSVFDFLLYRAIDYFYYTDYECDENNPEIDYEILISFMSRMTDRKVTTSEVSDSLKRLSECGVEKEYEIDESFNSLIAEAFSKLNYDLRTIGRLLHYGECVSYDKNGNGRRRIKVFTEPEYSEFIKSLVNGGNENE